MIRSRLTFGLLGVALCLASPARGETPDAIEFSDFVTLPRVGVYGRSTVHVDAVDAAIGRGELGTPRPGDTLLAPDGRSAEWKSAPAKAGVLSTRSLVGGYAAATYEAASDGVMLLDGTGHAAVYVNGEPHAGDPYALGNFRTPVRLKKGSNTFVFHVAQRELVARLTRPPADVLLLSDLATLPSVVRGEDGKLWASIAVVNASDEPLKGASLVANSENTDPVATDIAWVDAASVRIAAFEFASPMEVIGDTIDLAVRVERDGETLASTTVSLQVTGGDELHTRTFVSQVDRSVQSYAVLPATSAQATDDAKPGLIVALHGAGVAANEFAANYQPKPWAHVIAPAGRGLYPLDWEDWAATDALEAADDAAAKLSVDTARVYATGHSMGGHGALVLSVANPDRFAAVGMSAAWPSLWTYGGGMPAYRDPNAVQAMLRRAASASDTLRFVHSLDDVGVYLLHGSDDDRVPVEQSRRILNELTSTHDDFAFHINPAAGNWWGPSTADWPPMMEFFEMRRRNPEAPQRVRFATSDLGVSALSSWVTIAGQKVQLEPSRVDLEVKQQPTAIVGITENVTRINIDKAAVPDGRPFVVRLDGGRPVVFQGMPASGSVWVEKQDGEWRRARSPQKAYKNPARYGGLKAVFHRNPLLVYGTAGSADENAWSRAKAHYDAATFAYRANGTLDVIPDTEFRDTKTKGRNVVLYGNVDTNSAWPILLSTSPVQAGRGTVRLGRREESGDGLGFLFVRPRQGSNTTLVGAIGGTGLDGMRTTNRLRYFWSGVAYPDLLILGPESLVDGDRDVRAAGYFAEDWGIDDADIAWRDVAL